MAMCASDQQFLGLTNADRAKIDKQWLMEQELFKVLDLWAGDALKCMDGSVGSCALMALSMIPGEKAIGLIGKISSAAGVAFRGLVTACSGNSFASGTKVLMADGSHKAIEQVKVGDVVQATDPESGEAGGRLVSALIEGKSDKQLVRLKLTWMAPKVTRLVRS